MRALIKWWTLGLLLVVFIVTPLVATAQDPTSATATVINFEDLMTTGPGDLGQVVVSDQYFSNYRIIFNNATALDYSKGVAPWKYQGFAHSGTRAIQQCYEKEFCTTPFQMDFSSLPRRVKVWVGYSDNLQSRTTVILRAYDLEGVLVDQKRTTFQPSTAPIPIRIPLEVISIIANIFRVTISFDPESGTSGLAVDDVEFDRFAPLPPSITPPPTRVTPSVPKPTLIPSRPPTNTPVPSATLIQTPTLTPIIPTSPPLERIVGILAVGGLFSFGLIAVIALAVVLLGPKPTVDRSGSKIPWAESRVTVESYADPGRQFVESKSHRPTPVIRQSLGQGEASYIIETKGRK